MLGGSYLSWRLVFGNIHTYYSAECLKILMGDRRWDLLFVRVDDLPSCKKELEWEDFAMFWDR